MPAFTNPVAKQCARWILLGTSPTPLPMLHPVREDCAAAADEIDRLTNALVALRDNANMDLWLREWVRGILEPPQ